tara:strand:+ start:341 stop:2071 length:1731 start_codon:yes stop_codon:yes gene_type:complete
MKKLFSLLTVLTSGILLAVTTPTLEELQILESLDLDKSGSKERGFERPQIVTPKSEKDFCNNESCIYGYNLFNKTPITFALSSDIAVPNGYTLGPGDEIILEYFGNESSSKRSYINRSGILKLPLLGPVNLGGLTLSQAKELIKRRVSQELIGTDVIVSLGDLRAINIYLLGEAYNPGTYTVGALSSLTNVLFSSGGVSKIGSLRNIEVKRQGKVVETYDFYEFLLSGDTSSDIRLQDGDTIFIPLIKKRVSVNGAVLRKGVFELKNEVNLEDIISLAGLETQHSVSFEYSTYDPEKNIRISSIESFDLSRKFDFKDGDAINILDNSSIKINSVELTGEFVFPGVYSLDKNETLLEIIQKAGGLRQEAYPEAAIFTREAIREIEKVSNAKNADTLEKSLINSITQGVTLEGNAYQAIVSLIDKLRNIQPIGRQVVSLDPFLLKSDPKLNIRLQDGDKIYLPKRTKSISVVGEVLNPVTHIYDQELTLEDYLDLSGGVTDGADLNKIFIVSPNGQAFLYKNRLFSTVRSKYLLPGSTIVVSRDAKPFDWLQLTSIITPILSDLAVSAAAIAAISDNN